MVRQAAFLGNASVIIRRRVCKNHRLPAPSFFYQLYRVALQVSPLQRAVELTITKVTSCWLNGKPLTP